MKRTLILGLGLLGLALSPAVAQQSKTMGKIHGHVTNPTGSPQGGGAVSLTTGPGAGDKYTFPVDANGEYSGDAEAGTYSAIFRNVDTPKDKVVDQFDNVKIVAGQTTEQNFDMSREEYIKKLTPDQQKQLQEIKQKNASAVSANKVIAQIRADENTVVQDLKDADGTAATAAAKAQLGASPTKKDLDDKVNEIKTTKYTEVETLLTKDTGLKGDVAALWAQLGQAQIGLKEYDKAEVSLKKAIEVNAADKKPNPEVVGLAQSELGELYARTGKVDQASAAYDAAAQANPKAAAMYLKNQTVIYYQVGNTKAQVAAADKAIAADPTNPLLYYLKGQGLVGDAVVDPKTNKIVLPAGCAEAYQKYLELAPDGQYAEDAKSILASAGQKIQSSYKAGKKS
jgi:tetratricopeptide (TPR) repeat protein